jgi:hypothetical protein
MIAFAGCGPKSSERSQEVIENKGPRFCIPAKSQEVSENTALMSLRPRGN